jgi:hypothetical protein
MTSLPPCFDDPNARAAIDAICRQCNIDLPLLEALCQLAHQHSGSGRRDGIQLDVQQHIDAFIARSTKIHEG